MQPRIYVFFKLFSCDHDMYLQFQYLGNWQDFLHNCQGFSPFRCKREVDTDLNANVPTLFIHMPKQHLLSLTVSEGWNWVAIRRQLVRFTVPLGKNPTNFPKDEVAQMGGMRWPMLGIYVQVDE